MSELVSVVMPVHNAGKYIEEAIRSVMSQTYSNWELLIVNDNSTDNSMEIVNRLASEDCRIKVFDNPTPTGYPATPRNMAVSLANGRYIAFLDSDDVWHSDKLKNQIELMQEEASDFSYTAPATLFDHQEDLGPMESQGHCRVGWVTGFWVTGSCDA